MEHSYLASFTVWSSHFFELETGQQTNLICFLGISKRYGTYQVTGGVISKDIRTVEHSF